MFNLTRYYSIASLVCIIVAAAILGMFYRHLSLNSLTKMAETPRLPMCSTTPSGTISARFSNRVPTLGPVRTTRPSQPCAGRSWRS